MSYINREDLLEKALTGMSTIELMRAIIDAPVADVRESIRGEWLYEYYFDEWYGPLFRCNKCNDTMIGKCNYCPNCGADMRGEKNEI